MYDKEKDFMINLTSKITMTEYLITYKDIEYIYTIEADDFETDEWLKRSDGHELTAEEHDEIMDLIYDIDDWDEV